MNSMIARSMRSGVLIRDKCGHKHERNNKFFI